MISHKLAACKTTERYIVGNSKLYRHTGISFHFSVAKFASEQIAPLVSKMDTESYIDEKVYKGMFENGVSAA